MSQAVTQQLRTSGAYANKPLDERATVATFEQLQTNFPGAYVGLHIYVEDRQTEYVVTELDGTDIDIEHGLVTLEEFAKSNSNSVLYTEQTLTDAQKTQARQNIGAGTSNFSGNYNDLINKPAIPDVSNKVDKVTGKGLSTNDYTDTDKTKVNNAIQTPSATENDKIPVMRNGSITWEEKPSNGQDGAEGPQGEPAVNPFKGWFNNLTSLQTITPIIGDYAYVKGATTTDPVKIYECTTNGTWSDSGREFNSANDQSFATGQPVNDTIISPSILKGGDDDLLSMKGIKNIIPYKSTDLAENFDASDYTLGRWVTGTGMQSSGEIKYTPFIPINEGALYKVTTRINLYWTAGVVYFSSEDMATNVGEDTAFKFDHSTDTGIKTISNYLTIPEGANYMVVFTNSVSSLQINELEESQVALKDDLKKYVKIEPQEFTEEEKANARINIGAVDGALLPYSQKLTDYKPKTENGGRLQKNVTNGYISPSTNSWYTDLIPIELGMKYYVKTILVLNYDVGVAYYKEDETYLSVDANFRDLESTENAWTTVEGYLTIPQNAKYFRVFSRSIQQTEIYDEGNRKAAAGGEVVKIVEQSLTSEEKETARNNIDAANSNFGVENYGKALEVGPDGKIALGDPPSPSPTVADAVTVKATKTVGIMPSIITDSTSVTFGTYEGISHWSGDFTNGFTHDRSLNAIQNSDNSDVVEFGISSDVEVGAQYLVSLNLSYIGTLGEESLEVKMGNSIYCDTYVGNNEIHLKIGFVADGGNLYLRSKKALTITSITLRKVVEAGTEGSEETTLSLLNVNNKGSLSNIVDAFWNTAVGYDGCMPALVNGSRNIAIGRNALVSLKWGTRNIGVGTFSGMAVVGGSNNISIGADSLYIGFSATAKIEKNIAIGRTCLNGGTNTTLAVGNVAIGYTAMNHAVATTQNSIAIGNGAGDKGGDSNICIGYRSGYYATGIKNIFIGSEVGYGTGGAGNRNICIGYSSDTNIGNGASYIINIAGGTGNATTGAILIGHPTNNLVNGKPLLYIAGKLINFNDDGTITWEGIQQEGE